MSGDTTPVLASITPAGNPPNHPGWVGIRRVRPGGVGQRRTAAPGGEPAGALDGAVATNVPGQGVARTVLDAAENTVYQTQVTVLDVTLRAATRMSRGRRRVGDVPRPLAGPALAQRSRGRVAQPGDLPVPMVGEHASHWRGQVDSWRSYHRVGRLTGYGEPPPRSARRGLAVVSEPEAQPKKLNVRFIRSALSEAVP